jgi:hypothetical protein
VISKDGTEILSLWKRRSPTLSGLFFGCFVVETQEYEFQTDEKKTYF